MEISDFQTTEIVKIVFGVSEATVYYDLQKVDYKYQIKTYLSWKLPSSEDNIKMTKRKEIVSFPALK